MRSFKSICCCSTLIAGSAALIWLAMPFGAAAVSPAAPAATPAAPVPAPEPAPAPAQDADSLCFDAPVCVFGWSKDICQGEMFSDFVTEYGCKRTIDGNTVECKTIVVKSAVFDFPINSNPDKCCSADELCDETKHLNGTLYINANFTFRANNCCPYRGCWCGDWKLVDQGGTTIASGTAAGPLGTGSHRAPDCPDPQKQCSPDCEKCYDVQYVPDQFNPQYGTWYVGLEGCLHGTVFKGPFESSGVCVTISGHLLTGGTINGPSSFGAWKFCGASDGTILAKCS